MGRHPASPSGISTFLPQRFPRCFSLFLPTPSDTDAKRTTLARERDASGHLVGDEEGWDVEALEQDLSRPLPVAHSGGSV